MTNKTTAIDGTMTNADIKKEAQTRTDNLMNDCKVFWAFNNEQFAESKTELKEGEKYVSIGAGGYLPKGYRDTLFDGLKEIKKWEKAQRKALKDADKEKHIISVLANYESFHTYNIEDALPELLPFYTKEYIQEVFNKNIETQVQY
jgi:hypothetical protein